MSKKEYKKFDKYLNDHTLANLGKLLNEDVPLKGIDFEKIDSEDKQEIQALLETLNDSDYSFKEILEEFNNEFSFSIFIDSDKEEE